MILITIGWNKSFSRRKGFPNSMIICFLLLQVSVSENKSPNWFVRILSFVSHKMICPKWIEDGVLLWNKMIPWNCLRPWRDMSKLQWNNTDKFKKLWILMNKWRECWKYFKRAEMWIIITDFLLVFLDFFAFDTYILISFKFCLNK